VCEGLGFESGVNKRWKEAPVFYWLYTLLIVFGALIVMSPGFDMVKNILLSQVLNGMLLPFILIFMILLINKYALMKEWVNPRAYNFVAWATVIIVIGMTVALTAITIRNP
jgi:Mn2+/Fe2+ NRAMP family transporter